MAATLTIPTIFTGVDRISAVVERMKKSVGGFAGKVEGSVLRADRWFNKLTPSIGNTTKQLFRFASSAALAGSIIAGITFSAKSIMDYEVALHSLQAVTGVSYKLFTGQIESIAKRTRKSSIDVAGAFEVVGSAMSQYLQNPKALGQITEAGITLAKASRQDMVPTLDNLTNIMNQFKLGAGQAEYAINRLTAGEIVGSMRTSEVASALQDFGASAKLANVNLGESVALVEVLGRQMKHAEVGNAAKNIMVILNAAKGLAKRARTELLKNKVNLGMLMDNKIPLGARLTELSKILKDPIAMVKVFGRENLTAGQVILSNLKTYLEWEKQIQKTNEAHHQAAVNADTLINRLAELKNQWTTYITTNSHATAGLNRVKNAVKYLTDNFDLVIDRVITATKWFIGIKVALWGVRSAMLLYRAANLFLAGSSAIATTAVEAETVAVAGLGTAMGGVTTQIGAATTGMRALMGTLSGFSIPAAVLAFVGYQAYKGITDPDNDFHSKMREMQREEERQRKRNPNYYIDLNKSTYREMARKKAEADSVQALAKQGFRSFNPPIAKIDTSLNRLKDDAFTIPNVNKHPANFNYWGDGAKNNATIHIILDDPKGNVSDVKRATNSGSPKIKVTVSHTSGVR